MQHFAFGQRQQQVLGVMLAQYVIQQARRGLQLAQRARHAPRQAGYQQACDARDATELAPRKLAQVHRRTQIVQQLIGGEQRMPLRRVQVDRLRRCQHQAVIIHGIADAVALLAGAAQCQQGGQRLVHVASGEGIDEEELAFAAAYVLQQHVVRAGKRRHLLLKCQQRCQPARFRTVVGA